MMRRLVVIAVAAAGICVAMPAGAEEIGVGVGPGGVTVGTSHGDRYRDRTVKLFASATTGIAILS